MNYLVKLTQVRLFHHRPIAIPAGLIVGLEKLTPYPWAYKELNGEMVEQNCLVSLYTDCGYGTSLVVKETLEEIEKQLNS